MADEEAVHVQRRVSALLTPADASHNEQSRRLLQRLGRIVHDVAGRTSTAGLLDRMESAVVRAVHDSQGLPPQSPLAWVLERGSPTAISALVRIAARVVLLEQPHPGIPG
ncbi:hypothetical protein ACIA78_12630 [Streptomyces xanthochromogenes]|uniref:hypothetical protein n=1 Tax=Streptomyces xanthochromogenes TaxID=67384 RepID=UPI00379684A5